MLLRALRKVFGSRNDRLLRQFRSTLLRINALEPQIQALSDAALAAKTAQFRERFAQGETLDQMLPEAFAVVREASLRVLGMRHFDVQLIGGMALHHGKIAEMRTGEGKTLVATLPAYLNAIPGKGVHVITVNDYLAKRDAAWMGRIYQFLGLRVGTILSSERDHKQAMYATDITYGTNNEFGFDYLRDNMVYDETDRVQRGLHYAIIDEVDSILIDEARTPLIISGQANDNPENYIRINRIIPYLQRSLGNDDKIDGDFLVNEKERTVSLTEEGHGHLEKIMVREGLLPAGASLYEPSHQGLLHHISAGLRAHHLFLRDQHYVVQEGQVVIVDEFTGRLMPGRRWSDGLHQAIEAKENCAIQSENQTLASITFQNYFRLYEKLSGMTGTADTEAYEFQQIYRLETMVIPTHRPMVRKDHPDRIYATTEAKYRAIVAEVKDCYQRQQPVLVGTTSIENSELLAKYFTQEGIVHNVLNAKQHEREAHIVAEAGLPSAVTIATNMAGRGTDIVLGGNIDGRLLAIRADESLSPDEKNQRLEAEKAAWQARHDAVIAAGGLRIIGSERHESRRIDNQLRGRSGRQGDPGESRFYLSLEDSLMRIFAGDRLKWIMSRFKIPDDEPIEVGMVSRSLETAQRRVEQHNFDARKQLLEFDDVANEQRKILYQQRAEILADKQCKELVEEMIRGRIERLCAEAIPSESLPESWNLVGLAKSLADQWRVHLDIPKWLQEDPNLSETAIYERLEQAVMAHFAEKFVTVPEDVLQQFARRMLLSILDHHWRVHLTTMEDLRQGIFLRAHAQKDPRQEFKRDAFSLFEHMLDVVQEEVARTFMLIEVSQQEPPPPPKEEVLNVQYQHESDSAINPPEPAIDHKAKTAVKPNQVKRAVDKVGRNDPCPCGSGLKYKNCHGKL